VEEWRTGGVEKWKSKGVAEWRSNSPCVKKQRVVPILGVSYIMSRDDVEYSLIIAVSYVISRDDTK